MPESDLPAAVALTPAPSNGHSPRGLRAQNIATVRRFYEEFFNRHDLSGVDVLCTSDVVVHHGAVAQDLSGAVRLADAFLAAFDDARDSIEALLGDDDAVLTRGVLTGTHTGGFMGIPATGRQIRMSWMSFDRLIGGRIAERWVEQDTLGLLTQLGPLAQHQQPH
jgi:predicted ester cyclase